MQKPLPRQTPRALDPPAGVKEPYTFFESAREHPFQPLDAALLRKVTALARGVRRRIVRSLVDADALVLPRAEALTAAVARIGRTGHDACCRLTTRAPHDPLRLGAAPFAAVG